MLIDVAIIAFLMGVAILLILLEIFLLPGITVAGVGGFFFAAGGLVFAYEESVMAGNITLLVSLLVFGAIFVWLLRSRSFSRVALKTNIDSRITSSRDLGFTVGDEGITLSRLAPIGKARINKITVEAKSTGDFIDEHTPIVIVRIDGNNVVVKPKETEANIHV